MKKKFNKNCKSCRLTAGVENRSLRERINSAYFRPDPASESCAQIADELGISRPTFSNHCRNHLRQRNPEAKAKTTATLISKAKAHIQKEMELSFDHEEVIAETDYEKGLSQTIALGTQRLERGEITVSTTQLLQAIKIKADYSAKKRGQDTELIKMMYRTASGLNTDKETEDAAVTGQTNGVDTAREIGPGSVHKQSAWDALTQRAAEVLVPNPTVTNPD